eukprot:COSAG02_NODE_27820_length_602_cov_0.713718_1_plen_141_part_00
MALISSVMVTWYKCAGNCDTVDGMHCATLRLFLCAFVEDCVGKILSCRYIPLVRRSIIDGSSARVAIWAWGVGYKVWGVGVSGVDYRVRVSRLLRHKDSFSADATRPYAFVRVHAHPPPAHRPVGWPAGRQQQGIWMRSL